MITSDHSMSKFNAPAVLALAKKLRTDVPFPIVSGESDHNLAVSRMIFPRKLQMWSNPEGLMAVFRQIAILILNHRVIFVRGWWF